MLIKAFTRFIKNKEVFNNKKSIERAEVEERVVRVVPYDPDNEVVMHCCAHLSPRGFENMVGRTQLHFMVWYKALWIIQHNPDIKTEQLMTDLGVSWPTAQNIKKRVLKTLPH